MGMELDLGLGLGLAVPSGGTTTRVFGFDLNRKYDTAQHHPLLITATTTIVAKKKRDFADAFDGDDDKSVGDDDPNAGDGGGGGLVGWPPVKSTWRNAAGGGGGGRRGNEYVKVKMEGVAIGRKVDLSLHHSYHALLLTLNRMFAKKSAGVDYGEEEEEVGIMTGGKLEREEGSSPRYRRGYMVTYEDGDGDWMLVGDVPWETFTKSVKRLKIFSGGE